MKINNDNSEIMRTKSFNGMNESQEQQYLDMFYESKFSPYDFMCLFGALNASLKKYSFSRDKLIEFIKLCKDTNQFNMLLEDINIKSNGVFYFSEELDEAIVKLKNGGIFYTVSPEKDSTMMIFENIPIDELSDKRKDYTPTMSNFLSSYNDFEINDINIKEKVRLLKK